jgi:hypothetical protein
VVPDAATWSHWIDLAQIERVAPMLCQLVDTVPTDLTDDQREEAAALCESVMSRCVELEHHLIVVTRLLAAHGIRSAVLKGAATAHLDYPDPSWRGFGDIDLLIDSAHRVLATEVLAPAGWTRDFPLPPGHDEYTHAVVLEQRTMELDLHQRLGPRAIGVLAPAPELLDRAVPFEIAGNELRALDPVDRLIHAAVHAAAVPSRHRVLSTVTDVLRVAEATPHLADEALDRAERWRLRSLVERAIRDTYAAAHLDVHPVWAASMRRPIRRRDRLVDRAYAAADRRPVIEELAYLRLLGGWRDRWRYVRGYFGTTPERAARYGRSGFLANARYVVSRLRSGRS